MMISVVVIMQLFSHLVDHQVVSDGLIQDILVKILLINNCIMQKKEKNKNKKSLAVPVATEIGSLSMNICNILFIELY